MRTRRLLLSFMLVFIIISCGGSEQNEYIEATGTIESTNITISSKSSGEVKAIYFDEGAKVKAGDTLLVIDKEALDYQLEQAIANQQIAEAQLNLMIKGAREEDIKQAEESLKQSEANFTLAKNDHERFKNLLEDKVITQKQYDEVFTKYQIMLAQLTVAKESYAKVKKIFRPEEIEQAKANLKKSKAAVELLKKSIRDSYVISPVNGFVIKKFIEAGETAIQMSSLLKISDLSIVKLTIYVSESELGKVKLGQKAKITMDTFPNKIYEGKVAFISPEAEFTPKNIQTKDERTKLVFAVKIEIINKDLELKSGMPADAKIIL